MCGDAHRYEHCKNNCGNSPGAGVAWKSFRVADMQNRFKAVWTADIPHRQIHLLSPIQNVCSMFPTGKKDTETALGKERKPKQIKIRSSHLLMNTPAGGVSVSQDNKRDVRTFEAAWPDLVWNLWPAGKTQSRVINVLFISISCCSGDSVAWQLPVAFLWVFWQIWSGPAFSCWSPNIFSAKVVWVPVKLRRIK